MAYGLNWVLIMTSWIEMPWQESPLIWRGYIFSMEMTCIANVILMIIITDQGHAICVYIDWFNMAEIARTYIWASILNKGLLGILTKIWCEATIKTIHTFYQYHEYWCPGSLCHQVISDHNIDHIGNTSPCLWSRSISTTSAFSEQ